MKVLFMGTPIFSVPILEELIIKHNVVGVVTQPDKLVGRKKILTSSPVKECAVKNNINVFQPKNIKLDYEILLKTNPDIIITAAYGQMIPELVLEYPIYKAINVHASLLPLLRGGSPMHRSITEGHKETGISIMYMVKKMDAGNIISQKSIGILPTDTVGSIHDKLSLLGKNLLMETLPLIESGNISPVVQDETHVTFAKNITRDEERINWSKNGLSIFDHIRGFNPWPSTFTILNNDYTFKIHKVKYIKTDKYSNFKDGCIVESFTDHVYVKVNDGLISLLEIQLSGKKKMDIKTFMNGSGKSILIKSKIFI